MSILDKFSLSGKLALVTGCKRGIGRAVAEAFAEAGADIIGVSATLESDGGQVGAAVRALGRNFFAYQCDFLDCESAKNFALKAMSDRGVPDILFNNAGTIMRKPAAEHPDDYWFNVINVNLNSQFLISREIGAKMVERGSGKIIFTASLLTF